MSWRKNVLHLVAAVGVVAMLVAVGASAATGVRPDVRYPSQFGISPPMSSLPRVAPPPGLANRERPNAFHLFPTRAPLPDPVVQRGFGLSNMPAPITTFDGIPNTVNQTIVGFELTPADTQGAVGGNSPASNVYVQWVNLVWAVYNKTTGAMIAGPFAGNSFWSGFGGNCQAQNNGDPIIMYDQQADRWFAAQFQLSTAPYQQCFAVSTSPDPTGTWYQYSYSTASVAGDYPKYGMWSDAYLGTYNEFDPSSDSASLLLLERAKMLTGDPTAAIIHFDNFGANWWSILPASYDGTIPPPTGNAVFGQVAFAGTAVGQASDAMLIWNVTYDWTNPGAACFGAACGGQPNYIVPVASYTNLCPGNRSCIPEPAGGENLDAISGYTMYRLQWRNTGDTEHLVANHTVNDGTGVAGIRWYEMNGTVETGWTLNQQGTYAPGDGLHRWMGSIAMDHSGNIGLGYSGSNSATYPSVYYTGRLAGDPLGTLPQGEQQLVAGNGVINTTYNRWGDYSAMQIDPTDDCTFWYTQMYTGGGAWNWFTRIGSFKFPSCSIGPTGTLTGTVTNIITGNPIAGALVTANASSTLTNGSGVYTMTLPVGSYDMTASKFGFANGTATGIAVTDGGTTTENFALQPVGNADVDGYVTDGGHGWPLYAQIVITASGAPTQTVYTDPFNGYYSVTLVNGYDYTFAVNAVTPGYTPQTRPVSVTGVDQTQSFTLWPVPPTCTVPGYGAPVLPPPSFADGFDTSTPPAFSTGWSTTSLSGGAAWATNVGTHYPSGYAADTPPNLAYFNSFSVISGQALVYMTTGLDLSTAPSPELGFALFHDTGYSGSADSVQVQVSTDGGTTWQNVGSTYMRYNGTTGWEHINIPLTGFTGPLTSVQIGFLGTSAYGNDVHIDSVQVWNNYAVACVPVNGGLVAGFVKDGNTNAGLVGAQVANDLGGHTLTINDPNNGAGFYSFFTPTPPFTGPAVRTFTASMSHYASAQVIEPIIPNTTNRLDFTLNAGWLEMAPTSLFDFLNPGQTHDQTLSLTNHGGLDANFNLLVFPQQLYVPALPRDPAGPIVVPLQTGKQKLLRNLQGVQWNGPPRPPSTPLAAGSVITNWPTGVTSSWGLGFNQIASKVWVSSISYFGGDGFDHEYLPDGTPTGKTVDTHFMHVPYPADMAFDPIHNTMWQVNVNIGDPQEIDEFDPGTQTWTGNSILIHGLASYRTGLAYDAVSDTFWMGGWTDMTLYRFDRAGTVLQTKNVGLPIAGLAYNSVTGHLFVQENSATDTVTVLDVNNDYAVVGTFTVAGFGNFAGAGLEMDCLGHLWAVNQGNNTVSEIDSGEAAACAWLGVPWLTVTPNGGTVTAHNETNPMPIDAQFIADGAPRFGQYTAQIMTTSDTPYPTTPVSVCFTKAYTDVPLGSFAEQFIHAVSGAQITQGCGGSMFCPGDVMTRGIMARWMEFARHGSHDTVPPCVGIFADVPCETTPNADYIEAFYNEGITAGCGLNPLRYCPDSPVTRAQMAVFIMKSWQGPTYVPPPCIGIFNDVPCPGGFAVDWIEDLFNHGITAGCGNNNFCPNLSTTRAEESVFIGKAWSIPMCSAQTRAVRKTGLTVTVKK